MVIIVKRNIETQCQSSGIDVIKNELKCSKKVYEVIRDRTVVINCKRQMWEDLCNYEFTQKTWEQLYDDVRILTKSTKLRFFQFRLINGYLTTNSKRSKWNSAISPLCTFCGNCDETVIHLLVKLHTCAKILEMCKTVVVSFLFYQF